MPRIKEDHVTTRVIIVQKPAPIGFEYYVVRITDGAYLDHNGDFTPENQHFSRAFPEREIAVGKATSLGFEIVE